MSEELDFRQYAPATDRNREPILQVLQQVLPPTGCVLEMASGTGQHAIYFAPQLHPRRWLPSDPNPIARDSIAAWSSACPIENLLPPLDLDAASPDWPNQAQTVAADITAIVNINMIHISPWSSCLGLMAGAGQILPKGGILYLYGPYRRQGHPTAPSNEAFDRQLRSQNPEWGLRLLEDVVAAAVQQSLALKAVIEMPANNLSVVFEYSDV
ncbi:MAG TPA: DUF938 domain-containing protein [Trichocoleus sp.]